MQEAVMMIKTYMQTCWPGLGFNPLYKNVIAEINTCMGFFNIKNIIGIQSYSPRAWCCFMRCSRPSLRTQNHIHKQQHSVDFLLGQVLIVGWWYHSHAVVTPLCINNTRPLFFHPFCFIMQENPFYPATCQQYGLHLWYAFVLNLDPMAQSAQS